MDVVRWRIVNLLDAPQHGPTLSSWHVAEWGHLYPQWNVAAATAEFAAMQRDRLPMTFIALDLVSDELLGSASVILDDELPGFDDLGPWLASVYIRPDVRGLGVGRALVEATLRAATVAGVEHCYLFTDSAADYYRRSGWTLHGTALAGGHAVNVLEKRLTRRASETG
jgi:GNAT superfamily N-acetyltransferase